MKKTFLLTALLFLSSFVFAEQSNLIFRESYRLADVQNLILALNAENVEIKNFRGYKVTVETYSNNFTKSPVIKRANKSLIIEHSKEHFYKADYCNIVIYIPFDFQMNSFDYIADSGNLTANELWADRLSAKSNTGSISINSATSKNTLSIATTKGQVKIGKFLGEYFEASSESGSISMNMVKADFFNASAGSGNIYVELREPPAASSQLKTTRGNITLEVDANENFTLQVLSNSGTFRDNIKDIRRSARGENIYKYNEGGPIITLQSSSGDIYLE